MPTQGAFKGFPKKTPDFFRRLAQNNSKAWFDGHRGEYQDLVMAPARDFVEAMGQRLKAIAPGVMAIPKVNQSLFRINRDTRFSKDKIPYKTNLGIWFWEGEAKRMECPGFYFHLDPGELRLGVGVYRFPSSWLEPFRQAVVDPKTGPALAGAIKKVRAKGDYTMGGEHYKRVPRGYDPDHPNAGLLRHNALHASLRGPLPSQLYSPELIDYCYQHYKNMAPIQRWLLELSRTLERD